MTTFLCSRSLHHQGSSSRSKDAAGLALIEVLAILVVLAVLFATWLPALARTRSPVAQVKCLDNLRQLMQANAMFALDNRDTLPYPNWGNSYGPGWLYAPVSGNPPAPSDAAYQSGSLWPFVKSTDTYICPLDLTSPYYLQRANKLSTYMMNGAVCGYGTLSSSAFCLSQFKPEAYCMWEPDEDAGSPPVGAFAYNDASSFPDRNEGPGRKHQGGTPIGTFGGAAVFPSIKYFQAQQNAGPGLLWCNPATANGH